VKLTIQGKFLASSVLVITVSLLFVEFLILPSIERYTLGVAQVAAPLADFDIPLVQSNDILPFTLLTALALALILSYPFARRFTKPLEEMKTLATSLAQGERGRRAQVTSRDEIGDLAAALNEMASLVEAQITELSEDRKRLTAILTGMVEGVLVLDRQGHILLTNTAMERMFGLIGAEIHGRPFIEILRHHRLSEVIKRTLETGVNRSDEITMLIPDERVFAVQASTAKEFAGRSSLGAVFVFHDVTALKHLEQVRKDFVANVSHELRTPLASIKGYIEALLDGAKEDPQQCTAFLHILEKHTDRLNNIISDLLPLSQIESGQYQWKREEINIADLLEKASSVLRPLAEKKNQTLIITLPENAGPLIGDFEKLTLAIINLLDNAIKYTPEGGRITLQVGRSSNGIEITVSDTGLGIPPKDLSRIFERFYRVDRARSRDLGGTGLGLSIVKHIVEAHGGTVAVKSQMEKGATFIVTIPSPTVPRAA
jgi:two-component system phosphate regulon sensor histidine kinase PhoR